MSVTFQKTIDEIELRELIDDGYTDMALYYANTPDVAYADSSATVTPADFATLLATEDPPYTMTFVYSGGNYSQWFKFIPTGASWDVSMSAPFHGGGGINLQTIRQKLGKVTKNMIKGTTTANGNAGGTTAICTSNHIKLYQNDYFGGIANTHGWIFHNLTTDTWDEISDWVQSSGTFTFNTGFGAQVDSGVEFELWAQWNPDEVRDAINWACVNSYPIISKPIVDYGFVTEEDKYVYYVPNDILVINAIEMESSLYADSTDGRTRGHPWEPVPWEEINDALQRTIEFKNLPTEDTRLRVFGTGMISQMYADTNFTEIREPQVDLLVYLAASQLFFLMANQASSIDSIRWREQHTFYKNLYKDAAAKIPVKRRAKQNNSFETRWIGFNND